MTELYRTMMNAGLFIWYGPDRDDPGKDVYILEKRPTYHDNRHGITDEECLNAHQVRCSSYPEAIEKAKRFLDI